MDEAIRILAGLVDIFGLDFVLRALVEAGILPAWVLGPQNGAVEEEPFLIQGRTYQTLTMLQNPAYGLDALRGLVANPNSGLASIAGRLDLLDASLTDKYNSLIAAIGVPVQNGTAPAWYTAPPDVGGIPEAVWDYVVTETPERSAWTLQRGAGYLSENLTYSVGFPFAYNPAFVLIGPWGAVATAPTGHQPIPDYSNIAVDDTRLSWLQRTDPDAGWLPQYGTGEPYYLFYTDPFDNQWFVQPAFTEATFQQWRDIATGTALAAVKADTQAILAEFPIVVPPPVVTLNAPPVWPGIDNVTLGDPVDLAPGLTITEAMDGVDVSITGTEPNYSYWFTYDDLRAYRSVGALVFLDDQGHAEAYQALNFASAVYCPRTMKRAWAVKLFSSHGLTGTVTPWTING